MAYTPVQQQEIVKQLANSYLAGENRILSLLSEGNITEWNRSFLEKQLRQIHQVLNQLQVRAKEWGDVHIATLIQDGAEAAEAVLPAEATAAGFPTYSVGTVRKIFSLPGSASIIVSSI